jgi:hypothetical protein
MAAPAYEWRADNSQGKTERANAQTRQRANELDAP